LILFFSAVVMDTLWSGFACFFFPSSIYSFFGPGGIVSCWSNLGADRRFYIWQHVLLTKNSLFRNRGGGRPSLPILPARFRGDLLSTTADTDRTSPPLERKDGSRYVLRRRSPRGLCLDGPSPPFPPRRPCSQRDFFSQEKTGVISPLESREC